MLSALSGESSLNIFRVLDEPKCFLQTIKMVGDDLKMGLNPCYKQVHYIHKEGHNPARD